MSVKRLVVGVALLASLLLAPTARAQDLKDRFNFRVSLSAMYLRETQDDPDATRRVAGPLSLAYGDLRVVMDGRRLPGNFDLHIDARVRVTAGFNQDQRDAGTTQTYSRGYYGGSEYQLNELWARGKWKRVDLGLGRQIVAEADALRVDGVRLAVHLHKKWDLMLYGGGYVNPYSRSIETDYDNGSPAFVGGGGVRYSYDKIWGAFTGNAIYLGGKDDGGPLKLDVDATNAVTGIAAANPQTEPLRAYVTWTNFWRPIKYLDIYNDVVVDVAGAAGVQLTRLDAFAAIHANKYLTLRLGYDHMSAIAIEMYLSRLVRNRTEFVLGTIENNLTLSRTARDEGRLAVEGTFGRTMLTAEGRFRRRVIVDLGNDPQFTYPAPDPTPGATPNPFNTGSVGSQIAPSIGWDATVSVRNRGSLWGLRPGLWVTYLRDYRARDIFAGVSIGRDFLRGDKLFVDLAFSYANVNEDGDINVACSAIPLAALKTCFGTRHGNNYQTELSIGGTPFKHWFMFLDYRNAVATSADRPAVITHGLIGRVEARY